MKISPDEWYDVNGKSGTRDFWAYPEGPGKPKYGHWLLPDGTDVEDEIADGRIEELPFPVRFVRDGASRGERRGDFLWSGAAPYTLVSERFVNALTELGVGGFRTYPVSVYDRDKARTPVPGYVGFIPDLTWTEPVHSRFRGDVSFTLEIRGDVLQGLLDRGVDQFDYKPHEEPGEPEF